MPISTPSAAHRQKATEIHSSASWGASPRVPSTFKGTPISATLPSSLFDHTSEEAAGDASWWGAHRLSLVLVGIYLAACLLGVGWGFYVFVVRPFKFYQFVLFVISLWILQVVLKFWRYLSAVDPARARVLASPRRRHAASQAAHNERAVRRLESGASD